MRAILRLRRSPSSSVACLLTDEVVQHAPVDLLVQELARLFARNEPDFLGLGSVGGDVTPGERSEEVPRRSGIALVVAETAIDPGLDAHLLLQLLERVLL